MADTDQNTVPQNPGGTGEGSGGQPPAVPPVATPPEKGSGAASDDNKTVTLNKDDYNKLVGQRDSNHEELSTAMSYIEGQARKDGIDKFLKDSKNDYPDLSPDDLSHVDDPRLLETEAKRLQTRLQEHAQAKILEIENPQPFRESAEARTAREAELAKTPGTDAWAKVLEGRMR
jgi:hypothetical protein